MAKTENRGLMALAVAALLALAGCDAKPSYSSAGGAVDGWPVWGHSHLGQRYSANTQITPAERQGPESRLDLSHRRPVGPGRQGDPGVRSHAHPGQQHALSVLAAQPHRRPGSRHGQGKMDARPQARHQWRHRHCLPRRVLLERRPATAGFCSQRIFAATIDGKMWALDADTGKPCTGFGARRARRPARQSGLHRKAGPVWRVLGAHHRGRHGDHRLQDHRLPQYRHARRRGARAGCPHRQGDVGLYRRAARSCRLATARPIRAARPMCGRPCRWMWTAS